MRIKRISLKTWDSFLFGFVILYSVLATLGIIFPSLRVFYSSHPLLMMIGPITILILTYFVR